MISPVTGRIGISQVTEGAYVQVNTTLPATVQELDRIYVDVVQASSDVLRLRRDLASGKLKTGHHRFHLVARLISHDKPRKRPVN